jgi:hypothetical protein
VRSEPESGRARIRQRDSTLETVRERPVMQGSSWNFEKFLNFQKNQKILEIVEKEHKPKKKN